MPKQPTVPICFVLHLQITQKIEYESYSKKFYNFGPRWQWVLDRVVPIAKACGLTDQETEEIGESYRVS